MVRLTAVIAVLALGALASADEKKAEDATKGDPLHPRLKMETTAGDIVLQLDGEKAPISTENFVRYAADGYYNGTIFHRVVKKDPPQVAIDVIQGGGFTADLDEKTEGLRPPIKNEWRSGLKNARGTIAMARKGWNPRMPAEMKEKRANSATSQFFINVVDNGRLDQPQMDGAAYCAFGKVVEGMDVVDKIRNAEVTTHPKLPMGKVVPATTVEIKSVTLLDGMTLDAVVAAVKPAIEAAEKAQKEAEMKAQNETEARAKEFAELLANGKDANGKELHKTDSGLQYVKLKTVADGPSPTAADTVEVHYTGWLMNGKEFDSSVKRGKTATFPLGGVIKGWTEGVALMKVGEKFRFIIPPDLAYGERGRPPVIPGNSTLVFDVELVDIK